MPGLVAYLMLFTAVAIFFVFFHLMLGKQVRPARPDPEKLTIYECGEPTIGSAWIQFDLRFYVVALLFVIFDVEVAFFFPWAVVFGKANTLANKRLPIDERTRLTAELVPGYSPKAVTDPAAEARKQATAAHSLAWVAFWDIVVFFGLLLVGFAYLWRRGDLDWVRSTAAERLPAAGTEPLPPPADAGAVAGVGSGTEPALATAGQH